MSPVNLLIKRKKMKKLIIVCFSTFFLFACPDYFPGDDTCMQYRYYFTLPVSFLPEDKVIYIGDTITITSQFLDQLWNDNHTEFFTFDSVDFKIRCHFIKVDTIIDSQGRFDFLDDFDILADTLYNFRKGNTTTAFDYYYDGISYYLEFKFIPKKKGVYIFEFTSRRNLSSFDWDDAYIIDEDGDCETNRWKPRFVTNDGQAYQELLEYSPNDYYKEKLGYNFNPERDGAHCFKVE